MLTEHFDQFVLFEDAVARSRRFLPLTYTRPVSMLRVGMYTALERLSLFVPREKIVLHTSRFVADAVRDREHVRVNTIDPTKHTLFINARAFLNADFAPMHLNYHFMLSDTNDLVSATFEIIPEHVQREITSGLVFNYHLAKVLPTAKVKCFDSLWSYLHYNSHAIAQDVALQKHLDSPLKPIKERAGVHAVHGSNILVHPTATIGAGTVLDATDGPIVIEEGVRIFPNSTIMGPSVIGKNSLVKIGAKIYEGTTIGPTCKVGGEIENSIVLSYSNKQHDGYLGHSYLGSWVNLGADTNTSDLKNDYSNVKVFPENEEIDTGSMFVGLLMGDHSKSAINTQFNTGTVVGVSCNIFDSGFPPKWIPNFCWGGASGMQHYRSDRAIDVAQKVMQRRKMDLLPSEESLLKSLSK